MDGGKRVPALAADAAPERARELAHPLPRPRPRTGHDVLGSIPRQTTAWKCSASASAQARRAKVPQVLTFGHTRRPATTVGSSASSSSPRRPGTTACSWSSSSTAAKPAPGAAAPRSPRSQPTATSSQLRRRQRRWITSKARSNPLTDPGGVRQEVHSFCIKDHRHVPTAGTRTAARPGRDRPLSPVAPGRLHRPHDPLCCENIFAPRVPSARRQTGRRCPGPAAASFWSCD